MGASASANGPTNGVALVTGASQCPAPEGAASAVWGATLPDDGPTGGFFRDGGSLPW